MTESHFHCLSAQHKDDVQILHIFVKLMVLKEYRKMQEISTTETQPVSEVSVVSSVHQQS